MARISLGDPKRWVQFEVAGSRTLQLFTHGEVPINVMLPISADGDCRLFIEKDHSGSLVLDVRPSNRLADGLYGYVRNGLFKHAEAVAAALATRFLDEALLDPLVMLLIATCSVIKPEKSF